jgi:hypothetical protein
LLRLVAGFVVDAVVSDVFERLTTRNRLNPNWFSDVVSLIRRIPPPFSGFERCNSLSRENGGKARRFHRC